MKHKFKKGDKVIAVIGGLKSVVDRYDSFRDLYICINEKELYCQTHQIKLDN